MRRAANATLVALLLGACASAPAPTAAWVDLFDGQTLGAFAPTEFGGQGAVAVHEGAIQLEFGSPLSGITWQGALPQGEYEVEVTAARVSGNDFFCALTFPVGQDHLTLVLGGWGGTVCGLSSLDGLDAAHNETRTLRRFEAGRYYTTRVVVRAATVEAHLDGELLCRMNRADHTLSLRPEVQLSRPLGIANFATVAAVRSVRWRPLAATSR